MIITLSPVRPIGPAEPPVVSRAGDVLTINGTAFDFGPLPEGGRLPLGSVDCAWIVSDVTREAGAIRLTLTLPHGLIPSPAPPEAAAVLHPEPLVLTEDGPVALPTYTAAEDHA